MVADGQEIADERRIAHEGIGDVRALQGEPEAARAAYQAALAGAGSGDEHRLATKLALLSPLVEAPRQETLRTAQGLLPSTDPLQVWIAAAMCWLHAERGDLKAAESMCQTLPSAVQAEADAGSFLVILTLQKHGTPPEVKVSGSGLGAVVTIGKRKVRFDGEKIVLE